jgi:hypothetical protein
MEALECFPKDISRELLGRRGIRAPSSQHSTTELVPARGSRSVSNPNERNQIWAAAIAQTHPPTHRIVKGFMIVLV